MLAKLPTYDEAIARLMSAMKEASAGKLVRTIAAVRDQKEQEAARLLKLIAYNPLFVFIVISNSVFIIT